jgi:hypothetical protein
VDLLGDLFAVNELHPVFLAGKEVAWKAKHKANTTNAICTTDTHAPQTGLHAA